FVATADLRFGPMTVIRNEKRQIIKKIPWHACRFEVEDWKRVRDARTILKIANDVQQLFSSELYPDLAKAIPVFEEVMTKWETLLEDDNFALYHPAIQAGIAKMRKYYLKFDQKPAYLMAMFVHPYWKLNYVKMAWGGEKEAKRAKAAGEKNPKDWQAEALKIVRDWVCISNISFTPLC
ncbi:hypothetical protein BDZ89DRAFT_948935, partial [Hymenopellis radicata]